MKSYRLGNRNYFKQAFGINTEDPKVFWNELLSKSRCSAYIRLVTEDNKLTNLFSGHTAWSEFSELLRTYKK